MKRTIKSIFRHGKLVKFYRSPQCLITSTLIQLLSILQLMWTYYDSSQLVHPTIGNVKAIVKELVLLVTTITSLALWFYARINLGHALTFNPSAGNRLVTNGLYQWFRHPLYIFSTISVTSYLLLIKRYEACILFLFVIIPLQIWRARKESLVLHEKFGVAYSEYTRSTLM
eukprot:gene5857-8080_t